MTNYRYNKKDLLKHYNAIAFRLPPGGEHMTRMRKSATEVINCCQLNSTQNNTPYSTWMWKLKILSGLGISCKQQDKPNVSTWCHFIFLYFYYFAYLLYSYVNRII